MSGRPSDPVTPPPSAPLVHPHPWQATAAHRRGNVWLSLLLGLLVVGGAGLLCLHLWGVLQRSQDAELRDASRRAELRAEQLAEAVQQQLDASLRSLDIALRHLRSVYLDDPHDYTRAARELLAAYPPELLQAVVVYGADGRLQQSTPPLPEGGAVIDAELPDLHVPGDDRLRLSAPVPGAAGGTTPVVMASRAAHRGGTAVAVIGIVLRPDVLSAKLAALRVDPQDTLAVLRSDGSYLARSRYREKALRARAPADRPYLRADQGERGVFRAASALDGRPTLFAWRRLNEWSLVVAAGINEQGELQLIGERHAQARQHAGMVAALALIFATGVALLIARLRQRNQQLQRSEARGTALFERSTVPMLLVDPARACLIDANEAAAAFYGYPRELMRQLPVAHIDPPAQADGAEAAASASPWQGQPGDGLRRRHHRADGQVRDVEVRSGTLEIDGKPVLYSIVQDITARRAAEDAAAFEAARLSALLDTASDGIHILDEQGGLVQFSRSFIEMLGYTEHEARTLNVAQWDVDVTDIHGMLHELLAAPRSFETRHRRKDGRLLDVEISARGFSIGGRPYLYASSRDISERKHAEQQLRLAAAAFEAQEGIVVTDHNNLVLRVNKAFTEITGYAAEEMIGRSPSRLSSGRHGPAFYAAMWDSILKQGHWRGEIWNRRKNGEIFPEWLTITAVRGADGSITHHIAMLTDITERKAAEREVRQLAFFDPLTQLPNRRLLHERLQHALSASEQTLRLGAALFIDLDDFKTLNDTRGHATGDQLLEHVAQRLQACLREGDTVARIGGDEFVVLLQDIGGNEDEAAAHTRRVAEKIRAALGRPYTLDGLLHHATPSIGITLFNGHQVGVAEILKRADLAMYEAKGKGRNGICFFDPRMAALAAVRASLEGDLRPALQSHQLVLHYQPQIDRRGRVCGAETLVRWQHPQRGLLQPAEFIGVAEGSGLIGALGVVVLEAACERLVRWSTRPVLRELSLAVNVSALQFADEHFVDEVRRVLLSTGANPHRLELELTESALLADIDAVITKMTALKQMGIGLALDDFGTGYSSLSYLSRLPLDQLKVDRTFVKDLERDTHAAVICAATIKLAHSLSLKVVAEGVETEAQRHFLSAVHPCDRLQGYLFGSPVDGEAFEAAVTALPAPVPAPNAAD